GARPPTGCRPATRHCTGPPAPSCAASTTRSPRRACGTGAAASPAGWRGGSSGRATACSPPRTSPPPGPRSTPSATPSRSACSPTATGSAATGSSTAAGCGPSTSSTPGGTCGCSTSRGCGGATGGARRTCGPPSWPATTRRGRWRSTRSRSGPSRRSSWWPPSCGRSSTATARTPWRRGTPWGRWRRPRAHPRRCSATHGRGRGGERRAGAGLGGAHRVVPARRAPGSGTVRTVGARGAAVFDLDRTLLRGASGPVLGRALREAGVISDRAIPGEGLLYRIFDVVGETRPSMVLTRQAARFARGWPRAQVLDAGRVAADELASAVLPFARQMLADHRAAGRPLVLATTTPEDMIRPLAERLGFDDVVATRYGLDGQGRYDGTIDGEFVWGRGKLRAVRAWAERHGVSLAASWAYSDSFYDHHLLGAVGHPVAVNPDLRLLALATLRRWPVVHFDVPAGVPKLPLLNVEPQRLLQVLVRPELLPWVRLDVDGVDRIPATGPAILVANHRSYFDPIAIGLTCARRGRAVRFLAKREVLDAPVVGQVARALGAIRVERGSGSDEPLRE